MPQHLDQVQPQLDKFAAEGSTRAIWEKDGSWWSADPATRSLIENRLGWVDVVEKMAAEVDDLVAFADGVRKSGIENVVVLGMGGSSLAPDLFSTEFETADGFPDLWVLDSSDPAVVTIVRDNLDAKTTLFVVSSKSGTTIEVLSLFETFWLLVEKKKGSKAGENFIAITDPGTPLADLAKERGFRRVFENPADIGGRYSALSYFGLVPAALMGIDIGELLLRASDMAEVCAPDAPADDNPGLALGVTLGTLALEGSDKVSFLTSSGVFTFADWAEQLLAESTGKNGKGLVPVAGEMLGDVEAYGDDRFFVYMRLEGDDDNEALDAAAEALSDEGFSVVVLQLGDLYDLGAEFFRWQVAVAVAGKMLGVNPFDEPNVAESKQNTANLLNEYKEQKRLPERDPAADEGSVELYTLLQSEDKSVSGYLQALLESIEPGDYFSILAYMDASEENEALLQQIRTGVRDNYKVATTLGFGPRYLHSTGQLHKGGPNTGVFLLITADEAQDVKIPGQPYGFATLIRAQALGDLQALQDKRRRVVWLHLTNAEDGLQQLADYFGE